MSTTNRFGFDDIDTDTVNVTVIHDYSINLRSHFLYQFITGTLSFFVLSPWVCYVVMSITHMVNWLQFVSRRRKLSHVLCIRTQCIQHISLLMLTTMNYPYKHTCCVWSILTFIHIYNSSTVKYNNHPHPQYQQPSTHSQPDNTRQHQINDVNRHLSRHEYPWDPGIHFSIPGISFNKLTTICSVTTLTNSLQSTEIIHLNLWDLSDVLTYLIISNS